ncbi:hypothetical protein DFH08DRAFT_363917 [Mycena albidolilacea]|uniref:Uncharacterized protein n=1 Tax=Mycena albidolilacea TaxID=1033008 RepID=A0AAD7AJT4_9AGAR|nr:hypothetical protein DFH08DRAFT_363917 [Mycena albidolilacea]
MTLRSTQIRRLLLWYPTGLQSAISANPTPPPSWSSKPIPWRSTKSEEPLGDYAGIVLRRIGVNYNRSTKSASSCVELDQGTFQNNLGTS